MNYKRIGFGLWKEKEKERDREKTRKEEKREKHKLGVKVLGQGSKGIRLWPINQCKLEIMLHKITPSVVN